MGDVVKIYNSRTKSLARNDAVQTYVPLQGYFATDTRALVVSRAQENTSSLALNGEPGTGLQILAGNLYGKKNRSNTSGDGPFKNYLKLFLRKVAVGPGNANTPATRSMLPIWPYS